MTKEEAKWLSAAIGQHIEDVTGKPALSKGSIWTWG